MLQRTLSLFSRTDKTDYQEELNRLAQIYLALNAGDLEALALLDQQCSASDGSLAVCGPARANVAQGVGMRLAVVTQYFSRQPGILVHPENFLSSAMSQLDRLATIQAAPPGASKLRAFLGSYEAQYNASLKEAAAISVSASASAPPSAPGPVADVAISPSSVPSVTGPGSTGNSVTAQGSIVNSVTAQGSTGNSATAQGSIGNSVTVQGSTGNSVTTPASSVASLQPKTVTTKVTELIVPVVLGPNGSLTPLNAGTQTHSSVSSIVSGIPMIPSDSALGKDTLTVV